MANEVKFNSDYPNITKTKELYKRCQAKIPAMTQTMAKGPTQWVNGVAPLYLQKGKGARVWDVDGNEYLDYNMAIGPVSLGYCYPRVDEAIKKQLESGITFSLVHPLEIEVAEQLATLVPNAESVRYTKSGCDVTTAAVRISRAFTGRKNVVCCGYHGWHDWYIGTTDKNRGIPEETRALTRTFNYNDLESLKAVLDNDTACVIMEPVLFEAPKDNFLFEVRKLCNERGAMLIFDEMWTGFRLAPGGAQEYFDVKADLVTFSKAIANGMPIGVLAGRKDVMSLFETDVFFYTTFGGEALSLAAASATMSEIKDKNVPAHMARLGKRLREGYNEVAQQLDLGYTKCIGLDARSLVTFAPGQADPLLMKSFVQQELVKRGILWSGSHVTSYSHTEEDVDYTLSAYRDVLPLLKKVVSEGKVRESLRGEPVQPVFRTVTGVTKK